MEIRIQSQIRTYSGKGSTVYAMYSDDSDSTIIGKETAWESKGKKKGIDILISDADVLGRDSEFREEQINDAIKAFHDLETQNELSISQSVMRCNPSMAYEFEGVENGKRKYRINPEITNAQMATLAIALYVKQSAKTQDVVDMCTELEQILAGAIVTI